MLYVFHAPGGLTAAESFQSYTENEQVLTPILGLHRTHDRRRHTRPRPRIRRHSNGLPRIRHAPQARRPRSHRTQHHLRRMRALPHRPLQRMRARPIPIHTTRHRPAPPLPQAPSHVVSQAARQHDLRRRRHVGASFRCSCWHGPREHPPG